MRIVDPHVHFWDVDAVHLPWLSNPREVFSGDNRKLPRRYVPEDLLRDATDIELVGSVHIEANPDDPIAEARWVQGLADTGAILGQLAVIVAGADLSRSDAPQVLDQLSAFRNMRGIRQILNVHPEPRYDYVGRDYMAEPLWRENLLRLAQYRWSFDLQIYPSQVRLALEIIDASPNVTFIVNHAGMFVDRSRAAGWREWREGLHGLATRPNCAIKLSGFAMFDHTWTIESLRPYVLATIDAFGSGRCMFASNFPIDGLHSSYAALWSAYERIISGSSELEQANLVMQNAASYYRVGGCPRRQAGHQGAKTQSTSARKNAT